MVRIAYDFVAPSVISQVDLFNLRQKFGVGELEPIAQHLPHCGACELDLVNAILNRPNSIEQFDLSVLFDSASLRAKEDREH